MKLLKSILIPSQKDSVLPLRVGREKRNAKDLLCYGMIRGLKTESWFSQGLYSVWSSKEKRLTKINHLEQIGSFWQYISTPGRGDCQLLDSI